MKVGTDGVLLGAWVTVQPTDRRILDIGTGTGLIALILAQRSDASTIVGVDLASVEEARWNGEQSPWKDRLHFEQSAIQHFQAEPFDLILSNPPFFVESLLCPDAGRTRARHTVDLPFEELRDAVVRLLAPHGRFALILPIEAGEQFTVLCRGKLTLTRRTEVRTTPRHPAKRVLMEFTHAQTAIAPPPTEQLMIGTGEHETYTPEYRALTGDFYLKF